MACILLHNYCVSQRDSVTAPDTDDGAQLEEMLDFHRLSGVADDLMESAAVDQHAPPTEEDVRLRTMLTEKARQQLIAQAGWEIYQQQRTDRARRRTQLSTAMRHKFMEDAHEKHLTAMASLSHRLKTTSRR